MDYLQGKVAWVTGSSRGIGRAIAEGLASAGCKVAIHGRNRTNLRTSGEGDDLGLVAKEMAAKYGTDVISVCGDLTDDKVASQCAEEVTRQLGGLDILVCVAGGANWTGGLVMPNEEASGRASDFDVGLFHRRLDNNLNPTLFSCRAAIPHMRAKGWGRILTVGSIAACGGNKTGGTHHVPYAIAKSAIHEYTRCLAAELRHDGIPVNCLIPGNINTPSTRIRFGGDRETPMEGLSRLEHVGRPEDLAQLAVFLCGPGGEYISGECIRVDGGEQLSPC